MVRLQDLRSRTSERPGCGWASRATRPERRKTPAVQQEAKSHSDPAVWEQLQARKRVGNQAAAGEEAPWLQGCGNGGTARGGGGHWGKGSICCPRVCLAPVLSQATGIPLGRKGRGEKHQVAGGWGWGGVGGEAGKGSQLGRELSALLPLPPKDHPISLEDPLPP